MSRGQPFGALGKTALRPSCWARSGRERDGGDHDVRSKRLLNLRNVPGDEADEVRAMLDVQWIAFDKTAPNPWGISAGGIRVTVGK